MNRSAGESDGEAKTRQWLGGEAVVPRYPRRRQFPVALNRSLSGLMALAVGLGFAGGLVIGLRWCR